MTWQDELRRLEDDLVNGRVSAEDYRIRRDQLLTSANASPQQAYQQTSMDNTQIIPPVTDGPPPEATQAISGQQQQSWQQQQQQNQDPERTQAVSPGYRQQGYQQQPNLFEEPDRTQFVPGPGNQQQTQSQVEEEPPPWAGNEFPPLMGGANTSEWVKQGPEGTEEKSSKGKIIGVIAGVVVVALLAVGAYFLFVQGDNGNPAPQAGGPGTNQGAAGNGAPDPSKDLGIIDPPGQKEDHSDVQTLDALKSSNYLNPDEQQAYTNAVATRVVFKVGKDNGVTIAMVGAQASTADGAKEAAKALNDAQLKNNMEPMSGNPPKGVYVAELHGKPGSAVEIRAHYAHGTTIVRVHAYGTNYSAVKADFEKALADQLKALPADG